MRALLPMRFCRDGRRREAAGRVRHAANKNLINSLEKTSIYMKINAFLMPCVWIGQTGRRRARALSPMVLLDQCLVRTVSTSGRWPGKNRRRRLPAVLLNFRRASAVDIKVGRSAVSERSDE